jgi:hypothetical protein
MHEISRLGKYQYRYRGRRGKIFAFIFLHALIAFLGYYIFFVPDSLLPSPPDGPWRLFFVGVGAAIIVCAVVMVIVRVQALRSARIEIYERGFAICTGLTKKIVQYESIGRVEYYRAAAYKHGIPYFTTRVVAFYDQNDVFLAQTDSNTFRINEEAARYAMKYLGADIDDEEEDYDYGADTDDEEEDYDAYNDEEGYTDHDEYAYNDEEGCDYGDAVCADEHEEAKPFWRYTKRAVNAIFDTANWA